MPVVEKRPMLQSPADPELQREFDTLESDEDRLDFLTALDALEEVGREGTEPWEYLKRELGL